ncbi:MAG TPA: biopolymer transporter ExbD [Prolixibacteraceae bacterium]|nr:biopolymer transporter ExbD [Prolixibacteraceae bacterium]
MAKKVPEIPSASMADIAFMLLIFFLVTTTMDVDSGLERRLPPPADPNQAQTDIQINERNIFVVLVNAQDQLLVEDEWLAIKDLRAKTMEFLENPKNLTTLPEKEVKEVPFFGPTEVEKNAVISLRNDFGTTYGMYIRVQNELVAAVNDLRDAKAMQKWSKKFKDLNEAQQNAIKMIYPQKISEAEPKKVGVKK